jgi:apolipoprotein D and lipocalin family protein
VVDVETSAKLKVSFFGPFYGNYWVLDHEDHYEWSIVGSLPVVIFGCLPAQNILGTLQARVKAMGYDWSLVRITRQ